MAVSTYNCPNCGAAVVFNAETQLFGCDYCGGSFTEPEIKQLTDALAGKNQERAKVEQESEAIGGQINYHCSQCGAEIIGDENTSATFCLYCQSPTIIPSRLTDKFAPNMLIPFKISKEQAVQTFMNWSASAWFVPNDFRSKSQQEKMSGLYVPFWLFDFKAEFAFNGTGTKVKTWRAGNYRYTQTDTYQIQRQGNMGFAHMPADGSKKMSNEIMDLLEPYNFTDLQKFEPAYLSGFFAEKYDEDQTVVFPRISERGKKYCNENVSRTISGYTTMAIERQINIPKATHNYALLPVWILGYKYNDRIYYFTMNGQTGKVIGKLPVSRGKVVRFAILLAVISFIIMFIGGALVL
ncbi:hypothetical protein [Culicoidibacter larvae]|uniref:TFIIB-type zinc ribbon-containing protein n=1 Tax=Culicoidibacter larvae TaxID=2579976 RepID=A0A5R8Q8T8_9FIRM|nr:hypothetical protein [Culicoidibacter larvae]TLG71224.1 hypothetical protein FEZ08_11255 [Culicoidibacter larvae]